MAIVVADFAVEGAIGLEYSGVISVHLIHFVVAAPGEVDTGRLGAACLPDRRRGLDQRPVHREMVDRDQPLHLGLRQNGAQELRCNRLPLLSSEPRILHLPDPESES